MVQVAEKGEHPYIVSHKDYCGGSPVITGTKFPVRSVINYVLRQGLSPEELGKEFSHLTLAQIYEYEAESMLWLLWCWTTDRMVTTGL